MSSITSDDDQLSTIRGFYNQLVLVIGKMWWFIFLVTLFGKSACFGEVIIVRDSDCDDPCFRRLLSGKRIVDPYIKRVMECERLHDCHRMCEYERGFTCEGFNYRSHAGAKGMCELSSTPPTQVDVNRDFISDPRYDYYERDWTRRRCERRRDKVQPDSRDWWGESDGRRPVWTPRGSAGSGHYIPPVTPAPPGGTGPLPYGGTFMGRTKLTLDYDRSQPDPWFRSTVLVRPTHPPPLPVRPLEDSWPTFPQRHETYGFHQRDRDRTPIPGVGYPRYLPSRPSDHGYSGNGYSYGRPGDGIWMTGRRYGQNYPIRRIGPDPVTNEISHYVPDRRKPSKPDPAEGYGPSYGDGYPDHSGHPKPSPRPLHLEPPHSKAPPGHDSQYGPFHNYGGAYGYDRPAVPRVPPTPPSRRACSVRSAGGFRLAKGIIRKSYLTANLGQCESLCQSQKEFTCLTFAYRYNLAATSPSDNCLLSDAPLENLIFYTDLEPDRDYDIYAIMINPKWCETRGRPSSSPRRTRPPDECFWRVRTGFGMPPAVVKKPTRVEGMGECQVQCVHARDFTCRSFVFRYDSSVSGLPNCYLSDWPAVEIDPHKMLDMEGAELYERGSFGRGCEPHHPIPSPDPTTPSRPALDYKPSHTDEASCYAGYDRPCKLTPYAIILTAKVDSEADCRRRCTVMRENVGRNSAPCMSFSYKISGDDIEDNCHMSDVPTRDLRPGLDYTHDEEYSLYVFKELEPKCVPSNEYSSKPYADPEDPYYYEVTPLDTSKPGESDLGYHYPMPHDRPSNPQDERFFYPPELMVFNHYTVNGHPCKRGTKCERHPVAGFWSCQTEGSEPDSWEYCCEPSHQCGFSQGSSYPWCYVGGSRDQWRPCSERYFPYSSKSRPPRPGGPSSKCHYEVDCEGRHWPVAVLHGEAPPSHNWEISQGPAPNGTDSVALANTHDHRGLNDSEEVIPSVKAIEDSKNSTNSTTSGVKKRRSEGVLFPLRSLPQEKAPESFQRPNSRFRPLPISNSSQNGTQFFITRRLNAALSTQESEKSRSRGTVAKIERIERPTEGGNDVQRLVTVSSKSRAAQHDLKIRVPVISVLVSNSTTVRPNSRHWVKMETIGRNDSSV